jgi:type II secretory pathway pseudopilin PulG
MELLITILIIGIMVAVGVPFYMGYVKDSRLAEGKALLGSAITAAQSCAQGEPTTGCDLPRLRGKVGLTTSDTTGDGKWKVSMSGGPLTLDTSSNKFGPPGVVITAAGQTGNVSGIAVTGTSDGSGNFSLRCNVTSNSPATSSDPAC